MYCSYNSRDLDIQIRIDNLRRAHNYKYPLSWYEEQSDTIIRAMHTNELVRHAENLSKNYTNNTTQFIG